MPTSTTRIKASYRDAEDRATQVVLQWGIDGVWRPGEE